MLNTKIKANEDGLVKWCLVTHGEQDERCAWVNEIMKYFKFNSRSFGEPRYHFSRSAKGTTACLLYQTKPEVLEQLLEQTNLTVQHESNDVYFLTGAINLEKTLKIKRRLDPTKNYNEMYWEFEKKYNPYPVDMACYEAFRYALNDGLIDEDTYYEAREYFGKLWNYVGD